MRVACNRFFKIADEQLDPIPVVQAALPAPQLKPFIHVLDRVRRSRLPPVLNAEIWDKAAVLCGSTV